MKIEEIAHKKSVASYFSHSVDYWGKVYDDGGNKTEEFSCYAKNRRKSIVIDCLESYALQRSLTVLDIGCGPGVFMEEALRRGHEVTGIDISEEMVRKAGERLERSGHGKFTCRQGDAENIPLGNNTVDVVFCLGVLPYLKDDRKAVAEIDRVLKKGGTVIVILPNILKLANLLDCYYYLVRIWQYLWYRLRRNTPHPEKVLDPACFDKNREFGVRRYTRSQAATLFDGYGAPSEEDVTVIEYGPLTLWRRKILSDRLSIALSEFLVKRSGRWSWLKNFSNEWMVCFTKTS